MFWCWISNRNFANQKCYDNIWADYMFNSADGSVANPRGILKYVDIFSSNGFIFVLIFSMLWWGLKELLAAVVDLFLMSFIFFLTPSIRLCDPGEYVLFGFDYCTDLFGGDWQRGGLVEAFQKDPESDKYVY